MFSDVLETRESLCCGRLTWLPIDALNRDVEYESSTSEDQELS
jgi:hypothetical protein